VILVAAVATGRGRQSKAAFQEPLWYVVTFRDRLVVRVETYSESVQALEAAGLRD
jgi:hypothetical protein